MSAPSSSVDSRGPSPEASGAGYADTVRYGEREIAFDVVRSERATLGLHVHPSGRVEVRAPQEADVEAVRARVHKRARWIVRHQRRFSEIVREVSPKQFMHGETHRYLGRQYRLKVIGVEDARASGVRLIGRYFEVRTARPDAPEETERLLQAWYRRKAETRLRQRFETWREAMSRYDLQPSRLRIRTMSRRWGSCTANGTVTLHPDLVQAPSACIDYVVVHELCHLVHPHHGPAFYGLLGRVLPDWADYKRRLERVQPAAEGAQ